MNGNDCNSFEGRLELLMSGRSNEDERRAADEHLAVCSRCRELYGLAREELGSFDAPPPPGMIESILDRTSGSPCSSSRERLCDLVDGTLEAIDRQLVELHIEGCPGCTRLHATLVHLHEDLPAFAQLQPDPSFVSEVLVRTRKTARKSWPERLVAAWRAWLLRPRAAFEMGYVGAIAVWLIVAAPFSPVGGRQLEALASLNPVGAIAGPQSPAGKLEQGVLSAGREAWRTTAETGRQSLSWLSSDLKQRYDATDAAARELGRWSADLGEQSIDRLWRQFTVETEDHTPIETEQETEGRQQ